MVEGAIQSDAHGRTMELHPHDLAESEKHDSHGESVYKHSQHMSP